jgi:hypothetical protein
MQKKFLFFILIFSFVTVAHDVSAETVTERIYADSSNWGMATSPYPGSWDVQYHSTMGNDPQMQTYRTPVYVGANHTPTGYLTMYRSFLSFDTSSLPDEAEIVSASLKIHPDIVLDDYPSDQSYVAVLEGRQASSTEFSFDDVEMCGNTLESPDLLSGKVQISSVVVDSELLIPLNNEGFSKIDRDGFTKLCLREGHDIENVEVTNDGGFWKESGLTFYTSLQIGTSSDPYLEVTYEVADEKTLGELLLEIRGYVKGEVQVKVLRELYLTHLTVFEKLYGRVSEHVSIRHLEVLKMRVEHDMKKKYIGKSVGEEIVKKIDGIITVLKDV